MIVLAATFKKIGMISTHSLTAMEELGDYL